LISSRRRIRASSAIRAAFLREASSSGDLIFRSSATGSAIATGVTFPDLPSASKKWWLIRLEATDTREIPIPAKASISPSPVHVRDSSIGKPAVSLLACSV